MAHRKIRVYPRATDRARRWSGGYASHETAHKVTARLTLDDGASPHTKSCSKEPPRPRLEDDEGYILNGVEDW